MNTKIHVVSILLILSILPSELTAHVTLDYPQGGETFTAGESINIQWHPVVQHDTQNYDLHYSLDGGNTWHVIRENLSTDREQFQWTVVNEETQQAEIRVTQDNDGLDYTGTSGNFTIQSSSTDIPPEQTPVEFALYPNYPNPFNPATSITYALPNTAHVSLAIYDVTGATVRTLVQRTQSAGVHHLTWDGSSDAGAPVESGIYFYRLQTPDKSQFRKMTLVR